MLDAARVFAQKSLRYGGWRTLGTLRPSSPPELVHHRSDPLSAGVDEAVWRTAGTAVIEPEWGYVVTEPWRLSLDSLAFDTPARPGYQPPWRMGTPSPWRWHRARRGSADQVVEVESAISLRNFFEWNYYHFYFDVLGKLALLDSLGLTDDATLVVGSADRKHFAREILSMGSLADRRWLFQDDTTYVRAERILFCRPQWTHRQQIDDILTMTGTRVPADQPAGERRILLTRRPPTMRLMSNAAEVEAALGGRGFEVVDTADMPIKEQIQLFNQTRVLVAVHGAGLTNIIYRAGHPMTIVELHPGHHASEDFRTIAGELGFDFRRLPCPVTTPVPGARLGHRRRRRRAPPSHRRRALIRPSARVSQVTRSRCCPSAT